MRSADYQRTLYLHRTQPGGAEHVHILGIANAFENAGMTVDIFSPAGMERPTAASAPCSSHPKGKWRKLLQVISRNVPEIIFELLEIAYNVVALGHLMRRGLACYDLVYERYAVFGAVGALIAKLTGLPLVVEVNYTSSSPLVRRRTNLLKPLARTFDGWIFRNATLLVTVSSPLKQEIMRDFGVPETRILILPNAADPLRFTLGSPIARSETKTIGFIGGFYSWHGLDLLMHAYAGIKDRFPNSTVVLIGDGPELHAIQALVDRLELSDRVTFGGRVSHAELPAVLSGIDIGVMPDSNDYGSPMKIFEYMAAGIPVVAPDYAGIIDAMQDGLQGLIFSRRDSSAMGAALTRLLENHKFARELGANGRKTVLEERNWTFNSTRVLQALRTALPARGGAQTTVFNEPD